MRREVIDECYFDTRCYLIVDNNNGEAYLYESLLIPLNNIDRYEKMNKFIKDEQGKEMIEYGLIKIDLTKEEKQIIDNIIHVRLTVNYPSPKGNGFSC